MTSVRVAIAAAVILAAFVMVFHVPEQPVNVTGQSPTLARVRVVFPDGLNLELVLRHATSDTLEHGSTKVELTPNLSAQPPLLHVRTLRFYGPRAASPVQRVALSEVTPARTIHGWAIVLAAPLPRPPR